MAFVNTADHELQKTVIALLMHEPNLRNELVRRYPGKVFGFFSELEAQKILKAVMVADGTALPSLVLKDFPELTESEDWHPQKVFDSLTYDSGFAFWDHVERLRQISKQRSLHVALTASAANVVAAKPDQIDSTARQISDLIGNMAVEISADYDPSISSAFDEMDKLKAAGELGQRVSTGIPLLDLELGGGLQYDPGEFVIISGFEKQRKSTLINNIVLNMFRNKVADCELAWVCNEGSVTRVQASADLWAMEATRVAQLRDVVFRSPMGDLIPYDLKRDDVLMKEFTGSIDEIVQETKQIVKNLPIRMYFAGIDEGNSLDFNSTMARLAADIEFNNVKIVVVDNFQGWRETNESDYEVMNRVIPYIDALTGRYHALTIAVSQYSREGKLRGGGGAESRANLVIGTNYDQQDSPDKLQLMYKYARTRPYFKIDLPMKPNSGLITEGL